MTTTEAYQLKAFVKAPKEFVEASILVWNKGLEQYEPHVWTTGGYRFDPLTQVVSVLTTDK